MKNKKERIITEREIICCKSNVKIQKEKKYQKNCVFLYLFIYFCNFSLACHFAFSFRFGSSFWEAFECENENMLKFSCTRVRTINLLSFTNLPNYPPRGAILSWVSLLSEFNDLFSFFFSLLFLANEFFLTFFFLS